MTKATSKGGPWPSRQKLSAKQVGTKYGFRSGLEERVAKQLQAVGIPVVYEAPESVIRYTKPAKEHKYTPDFVLPNGIIIETKGRFITADRQKHLLLAIYHPHLDIRFVFSNPNARISKTSKTTYADWCEKHGFLYAKGLIPNEWFREDVKRGSSNIAGCSDEL